MASKDSHNNKPLIGFLPCFYSIGETIPVVKMAQEYIKMGGSAIFFSHGGKYEYLAEELGCDIIRLNNIWDGSKDSEEEFFKRGGKLHELVNTLYTPDNIDACATDEIDAFRKTGIRMIVCSFNLSASISAPVVGIPVVAVVSGVATPPYYERWATFPDTFDNLFFRIFPSSLKDRFAKWFLVRTKLGVRAFNKVATKYGVEKFKTYNDIYCGDHTLVGDDMDYLQVAPSEQIPKENFIGPIIYGEPYKFNPDRVDKDILEHIKRPGRTIVIAMGSTGDKKMFLDIVNAMNGTRYNVIIVYSNVLKENELPKVNENILFKNFIALTDVTKMTDLAITHGGRGTTYTVAYSGKPAVCIPMFFEHQYNIQILQRYGSAIMLSKTRFSTKKMLMSIENIFQNYETYLNNAKKVEKKLPKYGCEKNGAERLVELVQEPKR